MKQVVTRFAPSPTGYLHIGGCRTALFNMLYSKKNNGLFKLRIEDTDESRNIPGAVDAILNGMKWLGLEYDGDIIFQSNRKQRYKEIAAELLKTQNAYVCNCPKVLQAEFRKDKCECRYKSITPGNNSVLRFSVPKKGSIEYIDKVYGNISTGYKEIEDTVILRSDGSPTYILAVVTDDHDMEVSHVIRGSDHIANTPKQILMYKALNWVVPEFAHLPLLNDENGNKLSKRKGAADINDYKDIVLPDTMRNYLLRLGWSHGDIEIINDSDAIKFFEFNGIGLSPSNLDMKKLIDINKYYISMKPDEELLPVLIKEIEKNLHHQLTQAETNIISVALPLFKNRGGSNKELALSMLFLIRPQKIDEEAELLLKENQEMIKVIEDSLKNTDWNKDSIEVIVKNFPNKSTAYKVLRCSIVGSMKAPGIIQVMKILGKNECLNRINNSIRETLNHL